LIGSAPFRRQEEQRPSVRGAKRATEYWAVVLDSVQHLTALSNSNDRPTGQIFATGVTPVVRSLDPDSPVRIHADGVRAEAFRPDPAIGQGPLGIDVEGREPTGEGLRDDQQWGRCAS
jgi:hypothetical protein